MNIRKFLPPLPRFISRALRGLGRLHLGLYFLFILMVGFGSVTSDFLESYSMVDMELLKTEWTRVSESYGRGEKVEVAASDWTRVFRPLPSRERTKVIFKGGKFEKQEFTAETESVGGLYALFLIPWLWPLYRHYFGKKKPPQEVVERRIINLPLVLFALSWIEAIHRYFLSVSGYEMLYGAVPDKLKLVFVISSILKGVFVSYLNLEITGAYIRRFIARPFFCETDPHGLKHGFSVNLTMRYAMMMFSLATVPLLLCIYIVAYGGLDLFIPVYKALKAGTQPLVDYSHGRVLVPLVFMSVMTGLILLIQALSLLFYRWNVQVPISALVRRMKAVAAGDFDCKTSVFYTDELGQLKGHFNMMLDGLVERDHIKDTFGRYVSIEIAEKIMKSGKVNLAGEEIQATVLFSDIRDFTPLSEKLPPAELIKFLNEYFSHITAPIMENRGVINKFIGDAVMAIFSPVFGVEDHRSAALRSALGMRAALARFNALDKHPQISFGVGLHSGGLVAGNVGTAERLEYTVLGDTVNVASRIESQTKVAGAQILLSDAVMAGINTDEFPGVKFVKGQPVLMKGKSEPLTLYTAE